MTPLDILPFFLLLGIACGVIGYRVGLMHGEERGFYAGVSTEHRASLTKIIRAKRDGFNLGCIVTLKRMLHGDKPFSKSIPQNTTHEN